MFDIAKIVKENCKYGTGPFQCRYLAKNLQTNSWSCCKYSMSKEIIDDEIIVIQKRYKEINKESNLPIGDNCTGFNFEANT